MFTEGGASLATLIPQKLTELIVYSATPLPVILYINAEYFHREANVKTVHSFEFNWEIICTPNDNPCNGPLEPNTEYRIQYQLFSGKMKADYDFFNNTITTGRSITIYYYVHKASYILVFTLGIFWRMWYHYVHYLMTC